MKDGVSRFSSPDEIGTEMQQKIRATKAKKFGRERNNFSGLQEEGLVEELLGKGGEADVVDAEIV